MSTTQAASAPAVLLPTGRWRIDPSTSTLGFQARGMFGLVAVRGEFRDYAGELHVDEDGARGELRIVAASLDTGNAKRDEHLRSDDFFAADAHPTVTFALAGVGPVGGDATQSAATGVLQIRDNKLELAAPLTIVQPSPTRLTVQTRVSVDRDAAGLGWSKLGMIKGQAHLHAALTLERD